MSPPVPRVLLMCLALAFASAWLGCGPEEESELSAGHPRVDHHLDLLPQQLIPRCGDGTLDGAKVCDDANTTGGDGCAGDCKRFR